MFARLPDNEFCSQLVILLLQLQALHCATRHLRHGAVLQSLQSDFGFAFRSEQRFRARELVVQRTCVRTNSSSSAHVSADSQLADHLCCTGPWLSLTKAIARFRVPLFSVVALLAELVQLRRLTSNQLGLHARTAFLRGQGKSEPLAFGRQSFDVTLRLLKLSDG
jgi:hypothetical protein